MFVDERMKDLCVRPNPRNTDPLHFQHRHLLNNNNINMHSQFNTLLHMNLKPNISFTIFSFKNPVIHKTYGGAPKRNTSVTEPVKQTYISVFLFLNAEMNQNQKILSLTLWNKSYRYGFDCIFQLKQACRAGSKGHLCLNCRYQPVFRMY